MAFDENEVKYIREEEAIRVGVRAELKENSGYHDKVEVVGGKVQILGFDMPFLSLLGFMIKVPIAAIPAAIIPAVVYFLLTSFVVGVLLNRSAQ